MKGSEMKILFIAVIIALLLNGALTFVVITRSPGSVVNPIAAKADVTTRYYYAVEEDTFIITTDTLGQNVYLYYFERGPKKEDSKLYYLKHISAR